MWDSSLELPWRFSIQTARGQYVGYGSPVRPKSPATQEPRVLCWPMGEVSYGAVNTLAMRSPTPAIQGTGRGRWQSRTSIGESFVMVRWATPRRSIVLARREKSMRSSVGQRHRRPRVSLSTPSIRGTFGVPKAERASARRPASRCGRSCADWTRTDAIDAALSPGLILNRRRSSATRSCSTLPSVRFEE